MAAWLASIECNRHEMVTRIYLNDRYYFDDGHVKCAAQHYRVAASRAGIYEMKKEAFRVKCVVDGRKDTVWPNVPKFGALRRSQSIEGYAW